MLTEQYPSSSEGELNSCERQPQSQQKKRKEKLERVMKMRWPKDFVRVSGQTVRFADSKVYIHQWNSWKNKNFVVEKRGLPAWQQNTWTIAGKGDEAMERAICKAKELA